MRHLAIAAALAAVLLASFVAPTDGQVKGQLIGEPDRYHCAQTWVWNNRIEDIEQRMICNGVSENVRMRADSIWIALNVYDWGMDSYGLDEAVQAAVQAWNETRLPITIRPRYKTFELNECGDGNLDISWGWQMFDPDNVFGMVVPTQHSCTRWNSLPDGSAQFFEYDIEMSWYNRGMGQDKLTKVVMHEIGHMLGLEHVYDDYPNLAGFTVMHSPKESARAPTEFDIAALCTVYDCEAQYPWLEGSKASDLGPLQSLSVYALNGQLVYERGCARNAYMLAAQAINHRDLPAGSYIAVRRNCQTGAVTRGVIAIR